MTDWDKKARFHLFGGSKPFAMSQEAYSHEIERLAALLQTVDREARKESEQIARDYNSMSGHRIANLIRARRTPANCPTDGTS